MICNIIPRKISDFNFNLENKVKLLNLVKNIKSGGVFPNILFYGKNNIGKYTLAKCLLAEIYGDDIYDIQDYTYQLKLKCNNYSINIKKSKYHYEADFTGLQYADRSMLISFIDAYFTTLDILDNSYRILIIRHFDELTIPAQLALRRKMETTYQTVRYITIVNKINKIDKSLCSRFLLFRIRSPNISEIKCYIQTLITVNKLKKPDGKIINKCVALSDNQLSNIPLILYTMITTDTCLKDPEIVLIDFFSNILFENKLDIVLLRNNITQIQLSRIKLNKLFSHIISVCIKNVVDDNKIHQIIDIVSTYQHMLCKSNKISIIIETIFIKIFNILNETI